MPCTKQMNVFIQNILTEILIKFYVTAIVVLSWYAIWIPSHDNRAYISLLMAYLSHSRSRNRIVKFSSYKCKEARWSEGIVAVITHSLAGRKASY